MAKNASEINVLRLGSTGWFCCYIPDLLRLATPEESPAGVAGDCSIMQVGSCRAGTHAAAGC